MAITFKVSGEVLIEHIASRVDELREVVEKEREAQKWLDAERERRRLELRCDHLQGRLKESEQYATWLKNWCDSPIWGRWFRQRPESPGYKSDYDFACNSYAGAVGQYGNGVDPEYTLNRLERMLKVVSVGTTFEMTLDDAVELGLNFGENPAANEVNP